jgi:hypothetical protein
MSEPDFNNTIYPTIEGKLGRKLSEEENKRFYWTSGMRKEWVFNKLAQCTTSEQAEQLFGSCHLSVSGSPPSLWRQIINRVFK